MLFWLNNHKRILLASLLSITTVASTLVAYEDYRTKHSVPRQVPDAVKICSTPSPTSVVATATAARATATASPSPTPQVTSTNTPTATAPKVTATIAPTTTASPSPTAESIDGDIIANGATPCPAPTTPGFIATPTATTNVVVPLPSPTNTATVLPTAVATLEP
jgi:hypothetical protein